VFGVVLFTQPAAKTPPLGEAGIPSAIPLQIPLPSVGIGDIQVSKVATPSIQPAALTSLLNALFEATPEADSKEPSAPITTTIGHST